LRAIHSFGPLQGGTLIRRYKRFLADVRLEDGVTVTVFTPNSGSMKTCSEPGSPVMVSDSQNPARKNRFTLEMVRTGDTWVGVNTALANILASRIVDSALTGHPELEGLRVVRREVTRGDSRLDLLAADTSRTCYIEVKNVTYRKGECALFPDAVTVRGKKHLESLIRVSREGDLACNLFTIQRSDCRYFSAARDIDPAYAEALHRASYAGVLIVPCLLHVEPEAVFFCKTLSQAVTSE
jgi:sugar fermentation stimulation protein A